MSKNKEKYKLTLELDVVLNDTVLMVFDDELEDYYSECSDYISEAISSVTDVDSMDIDFDNEEGMEIAHCKVYYYTTDSILTRESISDILIELEDYEYRGIIKSVVY